MTVLWCSALCALTGLLLVLTLLPPRRVLPAPGRRADGRSADGSRPPEGMSTHELLELWRVTTVAVRAVDAASSRALLAERRRAYLVELERRDPVGIGRWLSSGPDDVAGPGPHLTVRTTGTARRKAYGT